MSTSIETESGRDISGRRGEPVHGGMTAGELAASIQEENDSQEAEFDEADEGAELSDGGTELEAELGREEVAEATGAEEAAGGEAAEVVAAAEAAPVETVAQEAEWRRQLREDFGMPDNPDAPNDQVLGHLANLARRGTQADAYERRIRELEYELYAGRTQQQAAAAAQPAEAEKPATPWELPEWDPALEQFLRRNDETGAIEVIPGGDPSLPARYQAYKNAERIADQKFKAKPIETLWEGGLEARIEALFDKKFASGIGSLREQSFADRASQADTPWMYRTDKSGQPLVGLDGRQVLTDAGAAFCQQMEYLKTRFNGSLEERRAVALQVVRGIYGSAGPAAQQPGAAAKPAAKPVAAAAPAAAQPATKSKAERDAERLKQLQRTRGTRGASSSGGTRAPSNGRATEPTSQGRRVRRVDENPAWDGVPDDAFDDLEQLIGN